MRGINTKIVAIVAEENLSNKIATKLRENLCFEFRNLLIIRQEFLKLTFQNILQIIDSQILTRVICRCTILIVLVACYLSFYYTKVGLTSDF